MKKLLILFFILSVGCFGQLVRKPVSSGGGLVGLKDTTLSDPNDAIKIESGINTVFLKDWIFVPDLEGTGAAFLGHNVSGSGLMLFPSGALQSVTEKGIENVLTDYGTLSGTVYVKDTNNVIKSLTFTNGLLTASNLGDFAGVFESSETNLTMTNYKNSPDYAEFLEFQKYLNMKRQLAKK